MAYQPKSYRKFLATSVATALVATAVAPTAGAASFSEFPDLVEGAWYEDAVSYALEQGYFQGFPDGTFQPAGTITRAQAATLFANILDLEVSGTPDLSFTDTRDDAWYAGAVEAAVEAELFQGYPDNSFRPNATITRGEFAVLVVRAYGLQLDEDTEVTAFPDVSENSFALESIQILSSLGIINGLPNGNFDPQGGVNRAQGAAFIYNTEVQDDAVTITNLAADVDGSSVTVTADVANALEATVAITPDDVYSEDDLVAYAESLGLTLEELVASLSQDVDVEDGSISATFGSLPPGTHTATVTAEGVTESIEFTVEAPEVVDPEVASISAINARQIAVTFTTEVNETSAENLANYAVRRSADPNPVSLSTIGNVTAELQEDGTTVVFTPTGNQTIEGALGVQERAVFDFIVDGVESALGEDYPRASQSLRVVDETAPTFVGAAAAARTATNSVTLTFSEPVVPTSGVVRINGTNASVAQGSQPNQLTVTTTTSLNAGSSYDLQILNFTDYAGNLQAPTAVNERFTVSSDVEAPLVTGVEVVRDNLIEVTFDKSMNATTVANGINLLDGNFAVRNGFVAGITPKANTSNRVFQIALQETVASGEIPFNNGRFSGTLAFTDRIEDSVGNTLSAVQRSFTLVEDTSAPVANSVRFLQANTNASATYGGVPLTNGAIVVTFNEAITQNTLTNTTIIDNNGVDRSAWLNLGAAIANPNNSNELIIPLNTFVPTDANINAFTLRLVSGAVTDRSLATNANNASTNTFNVTPGRVSTGDTTAPVIVGQPAVVGANNIQLQVREANDLNRNTVLDLNNYRLDGAPLPNGTFITVGDSITEDFTVTINLPAGSIPETRGYSLNVSNITDLAGNRIAPYAANNVQLVDDIRPRLTGATLNQDGSVSLAYSEAVVDADDTAGFETDFIVTINNRRIDPSIITISDITSGAEAGRDLLRVELSYQAGTTPGAGQDRVFIDVDGSTTYNADTDISIQVGNIDESTVPDFFNLNNASSLVIGTIATPLVVTDTSSNNNLLEGNARITVK